MIYDFLLIFPNTKFELTSRKSLMPCHVLAILQTCRLAYDEAVAIFYSENLLCFSIQEAIWFMDETCSDRLGAARRVALEGSIARIMRALEKMQQRMPALQVLHIRRKRPPHAYRASWTKAAAQIRDLLAGMPALRELQLTSMEMFGLSTPDKERKRQMRKVDRMLIDFVASKNSGKDEQSEGGAYKDITSV